MLLLLLCSGSSSTIFLLFSSSILRVKQICVKTLNQFTIVICPIKCVRVCCCLFGKICSWTETHFVLLLISDSLLI